MDVLSVILACSLHSDQELVRALIEDGGGRQNQYFVGDLTTLNTNETLSSKEEALRVVTELERNGHRPAVGLLAVPVSWADRFARPRGDLFDACTNVAIGTAVLASHEAMCQSELQARRRPRKRSAPLPLQAMRSCTLERYGADLGISNFAPAILKAMATRQLAEVTLPAALDEDGAPERSPVFVDGTDESGLEEASWSSPRLFLAPSSPTALGENSPGPKPNVPARSNRDPQNPKEK